MIGFTTQDWQLDKLQLKIFYNLSYVSINLVSAFASVFIVYILPFLIRSPITISPLFSSLSFHSCQFSHHHFPSILVTFPPSFSSPIIILFSSPIVIFPPFSSLSLHSSVIPSSFSLHSHHFPSILVTFIQFLSVLPSSYSLHSFQFSSNSILLHPPKDTSNLPARGFLAASSCCWSDEL